MNIFTYQLVHQINRKVNNFSRLRTILYVTLENFVVHTLKKTQNKFVESRQVAVYSMGVVGALLLKVRLSQTQDRVNVFFETVAKIRQTHPIVVLFVRLLHEANYNCCIHFCDQGLKELALAVCVRQQLILASEVLNVEQAFLLLVEMTQHQSIVGVRLLAVLRVTDIC